MYISQLSMRWQLIRETLQGGKSSNDRIRSSMVLSSFLAMRSS